MSTLLRLAGPALALLLAACADRLPTVNEPAAPAAASPTLERLDCVAEVRAGRLSCNRPGEAVTGPRGMVYGGQNTNVRLTSGAVTVDTAAGIFAFPVTVQNLLSQPIGTRDGQTPDADGVRVFFSSGPRRPGGRGW